jgi:predicted transposase YbfD/YdcC
VRDLEFAHTVGKQHGRIEVRRIAVSREVVAVLDWPGLAQVCRIERTREVKGKMSREIVYGITSLSRAQAGPDALLALARDHWGIENRLHWRRDVILREDDSRIRTGAAPHAMAILRNTLLTLLHGFDRPTREVREIFAENRLHAIAHAMKGFL